MTRFAAALLLALTIPAPAAGQETTPSSAPPAPPPAAEAMAEPAPLPAPPVRFADSLSPPRQVTLALSPVHLLIGLVELTGEVRLAEQWSVALIGGLGRMSAFYTGCPSYICTVTVRVYEVGAQGRWYLRSFDRGLHFGAEVSYLKVDATAPGIDVKATAEGLTAGPFAGYKFVGDSGFTFDLQGGAQLLVIPGRSNSSSPSTESQVVPLLNANLGWSF